MDELCIGAFLLILLLQFYLCYYLALSFYSCTCWIPTISVLNLAIFSCYSNLLLRKRGWTEILQWGVLCYVLPRLSFLWCYGVFRCSVSLRVIIVFRDTTCVIIILYSWHLVICEHFWPYVWNDWSLVMHTMSTWFWHKNQVWQETPYSEMISPLTRDAYTVAVEEVVAWGAFASSVEAGTSLSADVDESSGSSSSRSNLVVPHVQRCSPPFPCHLHIQRNHDDKELFCRRSHNMTQQRF
jgi:hypothetical protein